MRRSQPRRSAAAALAVAALSVLPFPAVPAAASPAVAERRPNILVIVTDDQRARETLKVMPSVRSWFVEHGTRFKSAFVTTPTCCPSRASIFTGMYAHNHGVLTSQDGQAENLDQSRTLQHDLRQAGYTTALFGKYLNGWPVTEPPPDFDRYGVITEKSRFYYGGGRWNIDGSVRRIETYSTVFIQRLARRFIHSLEREDGRPWIMFLMVTAPHSPSVPHRRDKDARLPRFKLNPAMLEKDRSDKPAFTRDEGPPRAQMRARRAGQLRTLMSVDRMVGSVRAKLAETGELDNTLAFFTSDNGLMWGEHALAGKGVAYEQAVHIPMLASWSGNIAAGATDGRLVANIDIAPTVYDATGVTPSFSVDGRSLFDDFARDRILLEYWQRDDREAPNWAAHRTADYKYIETYAADHLVADWREYYNLRKDPWELENPISTSYLGTHPDPSRLRADLSCVGTTGLVACP